MPPIEHLPDPMGIVLLCVGGALIGYAVRAWQQAHGVGPMSGWVALGIGAGGVIVLVIAVRILLPVPPIVKPLPHKPVNVANINNIEPADSDPRLFTGAGGTGRVYFAANGTLLQNNEHASTPKQRIYRIDGTAVGPITDEGRDQEPTSLAVLPGASAAGDKVLFAEGAALWRHDASGYKKIEPKAGTAAVAQIHGLCADGAECLMVASPSAGAIALYSVDAATPAYERIGNTMPGQTARGLEMSADGWRRATFVVQNAGTTVLYRWTGSNLAPVPVNVPAPGRCHSGPNLLLVTNTIDLAATQVHVLARVNADGSLTGLQLNGNPAQFDAVYGLQSWNNDGWVLARTGTSTRLFQVVGDVLVQKHDLGDLGSLPSGAATAPRGLVPLPSALGFVSGEKTFWNATASTANSVTPTEITSVDTLRPAGGIGYCAADGSVAGTPIGVEPWTWSSGP